MRVKATHTSLNALTLNIGKERGPLNTVESLVELMQKAGYKLDIIGYPFYQSLKVRLFTISNILCVNIYATFSKTANAYRSKGGNRKRFTK